MQSHDRKLGDWDGILRTFYRHIHRNRILTCQPTHSPKEEGADHFHLNFVWLSKDKKGSTCIPDWCTIKLLNYMLMSKAGLWSWSHSPSTTPADVWKQDENSANENLKIYIWKVESLRIKAWPYGHKSSTEWRLKVAGHLIMQLCFLPSLEGSSPFRLLYSKFL